MSRFRKELVPLPKNFYELALGRLSRPNSKGWALGNCPFHPSKSKKSFAINVNSGAFCCHGCGRKGDLVGFVMQRDGLTFKQACERLGCWEENGKHRLPRTVYDRAQKQVLVMDFTIDSIEYRAEVPDEPKTELERLRRFHAEAKDRLSEIRQGDAEKFEGEEEVQWAILADSWELMHLEVGNGR